MPKNQDGEIVHFELVPAAAVLDRVRTSDDFKFNVNLVILDFALRHGIRRPDDPDRWTSPPASTGPWIEAPVTPSPLPASAAGESLSPPPPRLRRGSG